MNLIIGLIIGILIGWFTKVPFVLKAYKNTKLNKERLERIVESERNKKKWDQLRSHRKANR